MIKTIVIFAVGVVVGAGVMHHFGQCYVDYPWFKDHSKNMSHVVKTVKSTYS